MDIASPQDLVERLMSIFPGFRGTWDEGEAFGYDGDYTFHAVFLTFGPESQSLFKEATTDQVQEFAHLVNRMVENGGKQENAVSTCFLEHASQIGVRKLIEAYLSAEARRELR